MNRKSQWYTFDNPDGSAELRRDNPQDKNSREYGEVYHGDEAITIAQAIADRHNERERGVR